MLTGELRPRAIGHGEIEIHGFENLLMQSIQPNLGFRVWTMRRAPDSRMMYTIILPLWMIQIWSTSMLFLKFYGFWNCIKRQIKMSQFTTFAMIERFFRSFSSLSCRHVIGGRDTFSIVEGFQSQVNVTLQLGEVISKLDAENRSQVGPLLWSRKCFSFEKVDQKGLSYHRRSTISEPSFITPHTMGCTW